MATKMHFNKLPQAVIFDWDNTLAQALYVISLSFNATLNAMRMEPWSEEKIISDVHLSLDDYFPKLFGERWLEAKRVYHENYLSNRFQHLKMMDGALELIQLLSQLGIFQCVVSNKTGEYLRDEVKHFKLDNYFGMVVGSKDYSADKPSPIPVYAALSNSTIAPSNDVWFIGDTITDIRCAYNSGCFPILYGPADDRVKHSTITKPGYEISSHQELIDILNFLANK
jgi:phosphoglycolate phosphatase